MQTSYDHGVRALAVPARLPRSAPAAHRVAHALARDGWRGARFYWRLAERLSSRPRFPSLQIGQQSTIPLDLEDAFDLGLYRGWYKQFELILPARLVRPSGFCIDVGANIGVFTVLFAELTGPDGRVLAFEPARAVRERLLENVRRFPQVTVLPYALGATSEQRKLSRWQGHTGLSSLLDDLPADLPFQFSVDFEDVSVQRLDEIREVLEPQEIDLLKVSALGWEPQILAGATRLFEQERVRTALIDFTSSDNRAWITSLGNDAAYASYGVLSVPTTLKLRRSPQLMPLESSDAPPLYASVLLVRRGLEHLVADLT